MITLQGKGVFGGIAIGKISFFTREERKIKRIRIEDTKNEIERYTAAKDAAGEELGKIYEKALQEVGESNAQIFEIHRMMLEDQDYNDSVANIITTQEVNAEYAVAITSDNFSQMFASIDDDYMKERAADVKDISNRVLKHLTGNDGEQKEKAGKFIICADDLAPSETVQLDKSAVLAFVTKAGSANSHTAILARTMNIPAIIGVGEGLLSSYEGRMAVVDGFDGKIYIDPEEELLAMMERRQQEEEEKRRLLLELKGKENVTKDGQKIKVYANIGGVDDVAAAFVNDAGGIGLFRSEFLYLKQENYPDEELQFAAYKKVLESMSGKDVVIRTLDIGADKQIDYFQLAHEENPAMGFRAIRICLERKAVFKTQLRALFRASVYGKLCIMFPMITAVEEVQEVKQIVEEVKQELKTEGIPYREQTEIGVMIETPAAVMISDLLAKEVDFFSIGTNDLTQYTLAIDRQNPQIDRFYRPHHQAILRMIHMVAENAHKEGKWVGICGELGADLSLTEKFLAMGIDELSVSPPMILPLREKIRSINVAEKRDALLNEIL